MKTNLIRIAEYERYWLNSNCKAKEDGNMYFWSNPFSRLVG